MRRSGSPASAFATMHLCVSGASKRKKGGRKQIQDYVAMKVETLNSFFSVFDGHGGKEAAKYAKENLWEAIKNSKGFHSKDTVEVKQAIEAGFVKTHEDMCEDIWNVRESWDRKDGYPRTSGTTVACMIIRQQVPVQLFIANVGDLAIVLGKANQKNRQPGEPVVKAEVMNRVYTPEDKEIERIEKLNRSVSLPKGVMGVWEQKCPLHTDGESHEVHKKPKLNMTKSLGDMWSTTEDKKCLASPIPDVYVHKLDHTEDKFIILGTSGLWNMITPQESVEIVHRALKGGTRIATDKLVNEALERWSSRKLVADNVSAVVVHFVPDTPEDEEGTDSEVLIPSPSSDQLNEKSLQSSTQLDDEDFSNRECNSSCDLGIPIDLSKQELGKRAKELETERLSITSPKKRCIMDKPLNTTEL